jgi:hypothetical protein
MERLVKKEVQGTSSGGLRPDQGGSKLIYLSIYRQRRRPGSRIPDFISFKFGRTLIHRGSSVIY